MKRGRVIALAIGTLLVAAAAEARFGSSRYELNGASYEIPQQYDFKRNFQVPWLVGVKGLPKEPDESLWLLIPASELAQDILDYSRMFHGYTSEVEAEMVVNVIGGKEAREFAQHRTAQLQMVAAAIASGEGREPDHTTGNERIYSLRGTKGTDGEGGSLFYLMPAEGPNKLPADWLPPSCQASPDINRHEYFNCSYAISRNGLTFDFSVREENLAVANRIPDYVLARLKKWQD